MDRHLGDLEGAVPSLDPGVTQLLGTEERTTAHHRLVLAHLQTDQGPVHWVDARDTASTYAFHTLTRNRGLLEAIKIARAWTAYQHYTLVRKLIEIVTARTRLVVLPNVCSLYRDDDLDEQEAERLLAATLTTISELAAARDIPVLLTAIPSERDCLESYVDHQLTWEQTRAGDTFRGEDFRPMAYQGPRWWQTTIPYWVDLFGVAEERAVARWGRGRPLHQTALAIES